MMPRTYIRPPIATIPTIPSNFNTTNTQLITAEMINMNTNDAMKKKLEQAKTKTGTGGPRASDSQAIVSKTRSLSRDLPPALEFDDSGVEYLSTSHNPTSVSRRGHAAGASAASSSSSPSTPSRRKIPRKTPSIQTRTSPPLSAGASVSTPIATLAQVPTSRAAPASSVAAAASPKPKATITAINGIPVTPPTPPTPPTTATLSPAPVIAAAATGVVSGTAVPTVVNSPTPPVLAAVVALAPTTVAPKTAIGHTEVIQRSQQPMVPPQPQTATSPAPSRRLSPPLPPVPVFPPIANPAGSIDSITPIASPTPTISPKPTDAPAAAAGGPSVGSSKIECPLSLIAKALGLGETNAIDPSMLTLSQIQQKQDQELIARRARLVEIRAKNAALKKQKEDEAKAKADKICKEILANDAQKKEIDAEIEAELARSKELENADYTTNLTFSFAAKQLENFGINTTGATASFGVVNKKIETDEDPNHKGEKRKVASIEAATVATTAADTTSASRASTPRMNDPRNGSQPTNPSTEKPTGAGISEDAAAIRERERKRVRTS